MTESVYELARDNPSLKSINSSVHQSKLSVCTKSSTASCCICLSNLLDPASLTCGHQFCEHCLETYWVSSERPGFIVCPLCRAHVVNVNFTQKPTSSFDEFRKTFNYLDPITEQDEAASSMICLKISILLPALFYILKWMAPLIIDLFNGTNKFNR